MTAQSGSPTFDFDFSGASRVELLKQAQETIDANLMGANTAKPSDAQATASRLLATLGKQVARFGQVMPEYYELKEKHFSEHGLTVPPRFKDLSRDNHVLWLRLPITLSNADDLTFKKLQCAVEFNPAEREMARRPRAQLILPNSKFKSLMQVSGEVKLIIGQNFDFEVQTGSLNAQLGQAEVTAGAGVTLEQATKAGFIAGPFNYELRKAEIMHSAPGTEQVFWTITGEQFFQETHPVLILVIQIPKAVQHLTLSAAMQISSTLNFDGNLLKAMVKKVASFFHAGAPIEDKAVWEIDLPK
jgi:hypothetical protein